MQTLGFGVGGYGTTQALLTYRKDARRFDPDLVALVMFLGNDLADNSWLFSKRWARTCSVPSTSTRGRAQARYVVQHARRRILQAALPHDGDPLLALFEVLNQMRRNLKKTKKRGRLRDTEAERISGPTLGLLDANLLHSAPHNEALEEAWSITEDLLLELQAEVTADGARFVLVTTSIDYQVDPEPEKREALLQREEIEDLFYAEKRLRALGEEHGFPVITTAEAMQSEAEASGTYFHGFENFAVGKGHWNLAGHAFAAELLADELLTRGLLP